jgi:hypothetical protein
MQAPVLPKREKINYDMKHKLGRYDEKQAHMQNKEIQAFQNFPIFLFRKHLTNFKYNRIKEISQLS